MKNELATLVDTLGSINAQIAKLEKQADLIKEQLRDAATLPGGLKTYVGSSFVATISARNNSGIDFPRLEAETGITKIMLDSYKKVISTSFVVKTTSIA